MAATNTAFIFFNSFKRKLGTGAVDLSGTDFRAALYSSAGKLSADADFSTLSSINAGSCAGIKGSISRALANVTWTALSAAPGSQFAWDSDAIVWTVSTGASATVKFAVFYQSLGAGTGLPIGYVGLVATEQTVTGGNRITLTPNTYWFKMSG